MAKLIPIFLILTLFLSPHPVSAHAFGTLYTLPIPLWLYLYGAASAIVVSFLLLGFFINDSTKSFFPRFNIRLNPSLIFLFKVISFTLFILTILTGFLGTKSPVGNFTPNFFWIIFLLGFTYLSAFLGNIWYAINPWRIIMSPFNFKPVANYPKKLAYFPALFFYFILIYLELFSTGLGAKPQFLSTILLTYTFLNILGAVIFGKNDWFKYGEFFSVFFKLISKLSPFSKDDLLKERVDDFSLLIFILFMLSSTAFDGFRGTNTYFRYFYLSNPILLLILSLLLFLFSYLAAIFLMKIITKSSLSIKNLSLHFAFSLIPIALAYNFAHYYTLLLIQGQRIIPLLSDPFNQGLNLFGTSDYQINVGLLNAGFIWNSEVLVIILGHIIAVVLAHLLALNIFPKRQALISQIPMLVLMVVFTITGLWILSQPLTLGG